MTANHGDEGEAPSGARKEAGMRHLTKKNPFMSLWLSGANKVAGTGRALWQAAARKQQTAMIQEAGKMSTNFGTAALKTPKKLKRRKSGK
ncbi:hypothetical protein QM467_04405 [Rhodoblastus sp. 17X3]|uniref:hypothetical protein n=1 Tax=Rhodoblastus sp. 17X3 TaxID=3047026 RepID=UPI0024B73740|nr:hypothetical protein [Rhodoblastus sp. 17X3]MDI9847302.1 hypothetical protein [Rhodoblastus sp. 17X3]